MRRILLLSLTFACVTYMIRTFFYYSGVISLLGLAYFAFYFYPKILPLALFTFYYGKDFLPRFFKYSLWIFLILSVQCLGALTLGSLLFVPLDVFTGGYAWSYEAILEWSLLFLVVASITLKKTRDVVTSVSMATFAVSAGGFLYEIPIYYLMSRFDWIHSTYPLLIPTSILSFIFLGYLIYKEKWSLTFPFFISCWFLMCWCAIYAFNPYAFPAWLPRLPTVLMLCILPLGLRGRKYL